ncbi:hypothetical protein DEO45_05490 [Rhodanobacter denitrificans]|uniref:Uncharacterized protein n=1 Tax=Rhodanobacter denitrificans TaxID=666685 RepID=A0A368KJ70_9GAMM|nr:hypothetical protein DEO45_05490 [Rhodanobacter denitrificans]
MALPRTAKARQRDRVFRSFKLANGREQRARPGDQFCFGGFTTMTRQRGEWRSTAMLLMSARSKR